MKQCITIKQLNELSLEQQADLCNRIWDRGHLIDREAVKRVTAERGTIGALISFLEPFVKDLYIELEYPVVGEVKKIWWLTFNFNDSSIDFRHIELCDALWEAVKYIYTVI